MRKIDLFCICENEGTDQLFGYYSLYLIYPKFQASVHLLLLYSPVCVGPSQKLRRQVTTGVLTTRFIGLTVNRVIYENDTDAEPEIRVFLVC